MTQRLQIYKCGVCGNIVEVVHTGVGQLVCCGQPMNLMTENTVDASTEKHVPVIEKAGAGIKVKVGSVAHHMDEKHYIEWVELIADGRVCKKFLSPGDTPEAEFAVRSGKVEAREYCNLHGLWGSGEKSIGCG